ncbi:unnamed protein product, partial [Rotaria sordida]
MELDSSNSSTSYASIRDISKFQSEEEILFSMHSVFRIGDIKQIKHQLWQVNLTLTIGHDPQLKCLTDFIRDEINVPNGWLRLALLMEKM